MKSKFILLPAFLLITFNCFSQLVPEKQGQQLKNIRKPQTETTNPELTRDNVIHASSKIPGLKLKSPKQTFLFRDTANAKLTGAFVTITYGSAYDRLDFLLNHYKPKLFLYDDKNRVLASWNTELKSQNIGAAPVSMNNGAYTATLIMKIDEKSVSLASFKNGGRFRVGFEYFDEYLAGGADDWLYIKTLDLNLLFSNPSVNIDLYVNDFDTKYGKRNYFSYRNFSCMSYNNQLECFIK